MKKGLPILVVMAILLACILTACAGGSDYVGTYYAYDEDGVKDDTIWVKLEKDSWSDSSEDSGKLEFADGTLTGYIGEEAYFIGGVENGVLSVVVLGFPMQFYADGAYGAETSEPNDPNNPNNPNTPNNEVEEITVSFNSNGGSSVPSVDIDEGQKVTKPADPTRDGYIFQHWCVDSSLNQQVDFNKAITEDTMYYAKWMVDPNAVYITVRFNLGYELEDESKRIPNRQYLVGKSMVDIPTPEREGYIFLGWEDYMGRGYSSTSGVPLFDTTLYASWQKEAGLYEDDYLSFEKALKGTKLSSLALEDYNTENIDNFIYVELKNTDLGASRGNVNGQRFRFAQNLDWSPKGEYQVKWWTNDEFTSANGTQSADLYYGSNINFLSITDKNDQLLQTYMVDFYVLHDYEVNLYYSQYEDESYKSVYIYENEPATLNKLGSAEHGGYEFDKYMIYNGREEKYVDYNYNAPVKGSIRLNQAYKPVTISYDLDGGVLAESKTVTPYTEYQRLTIPTKEGFDFLGWQQDSGKYFGDLNGFTGKQVLSADNNFTTLKAVYEEKVFYKNRDNYKNNFIATYPVITYTDEYLSDILEIQYAKVGEPVTVPYKTPHKENGLFEFWNVYKETETKYYYSNMDFDTEINAPTALFATYDVLNSDVQGIQLNETKSFTSGQTFTMLMPNTASEYELKVTGNVTFTLFGDNNTYRSTSSRPITVDITTIASSQRKSITVSSSLGTFSFGIYGDTARESEDAQKITSTNSCVDGDTITEPNRNGYTWDGWYDGETKVSEGTSQEFTFNLADKDKTFEARWYKVSIEQNLKDAGSISNLNGNYYTGEEMTVTAVTNDGYTWLGWYNGETKVSEGTSLSYTFDMPASNKTYIAKWYKLGLEKNISNAGTVILNDTYKVGDEATITAETNNGYTWLGWYDGETKVSDGKSLTYTFDMPASNKTYIAKWQISQEMLNFDFTSTTTEFELLNVKDKTITSAIVPNYVTSIGRYAFSSCNSLTSIVIPDSITSIGYSAFSSCASLTSITIPFVGATLNGTRNTHFGYIFGATTVNSSNSSVKDNKNSVPSSLKEVIITGGDSIGEYAFYECDSLTSVTIGDSVTSIGDCAFRDCDRLTSVTIGDSVTSIGDDAFSYCTSLTSVTIGDSVTSIGDCAFRYCRSLTSVVIPDSVTSIGSSAFYYCNSLTSITIPFVGATLNGVENTCFDYIFGGNAPEALKEVIITRGDSIGDRAFYECDSLTSIEIPDSVTSIGGSAFFDCNNLTSIVIPDSVTSIGDRTFYDCDSLTSIVIPDSVTSIGIYAFNYCDSLTIYAEAESKPSGWHSNWNLSNRPVEWGLNNISTNALYNYADRGDTAYLTSYKGSETDITIPSTIDGKTVVGFGDIFRGNDSLTNIVIPDSVTSIGGSAFSSCDSLTSIVIPDSVTIIGRYAFSSCDSLTSIVIPDSVTSIGEDAFSWCSSLTDVYYNGTIEDWCNISFGDFSSNPMGYVDNFYMLDNGEYTLVTEIVIPDSVTEIKDYTFYNIDTITSIVIPDSVTSIGDYAFYWCDSLTSIIIGNSVTSIGDWAFYDCDSLTSIIIGNSVTSIGEDAFSSCDSLTSIVIPDSVTSIGEDAFSQCRRLTIYTEAESRPSDWDNGWNPLGRPVVWVGSTIYSEGDYHYTINNGSANIVRYIGEETSITLPTTVTINDKQYSLTSIGENAFRSCNILTSIVIPDSVTSIGEYAFYYCTSLRIYAEAESKPSGWASHWNPSNRPVVWGYKK